VPIDMGCAWLHSADRNPWTTYAREAGFEIVERLPEWQRRIGREQPTPGFRAAWHESFERNERLIAEAAAAGSDVAVASLVPDDEFRPWFDAVMGWLMGVPSASVSSIDYSRYADSEVNWSVPAGLGTVIAHAARSLDVQVGSPVRSIDYSGELVTLHTDRGDLKARAVIVTAPVAVLAAQAVRFTPELPHTLQEAIAGVQLGVDDKVFFRVAPGQMPFEGTEHFIGRVDTERTGSYATRPAGQDVLLAFYGGNLAKELEERGELEGFAREELQRIFGSGFGKHLLSAVSTAWHGDEWSRGAYSAALPGCAHMRERMQEPVADRVFFAGEACSVDYFGTVMGAWRTGVSAAERALTSIRSR